MDRRHTKLPASAGDVAVLALVAGACSNNSGSLARRAASGGAPAPASLTVELDWVPNPDHVGLYYAQDKGYFTDADLTVNFRSPSNAADPIKLVGLNKVDLAITYEPEMFYGQQSDLPVDRGRDRGPGAAELVDRHARRADHDLAEIERASRSASRGSRATTRSTRRC